MTLTDISLSRRTVLKTIGGSIGTIAVGSASATPVSAQTERAVVLTVKGTADIDIERTTEIDADASMTVDADNEIGVKLHPTADIDVNPAVSGTFEVTLRNVEVVTTTIGVSAMAEIRVRAETQLNVLARSRASGVLFVESHATAAISAEPHAAVDVVTEPGGDVTADTAPTADVDTITVTEIGPAG